MKPTPEDMEGLPPELRKAFDQADAEAAAPATAPESDPVQAPAQTPGQASPAPIGGLSDFERAVLYAKKVPGAGEGQRNIALNHLAYRLLALFDLAETELQDICLTWSAACSPPIDEREARATIASAWKGAHRKGKAGSERTPAKTRGAGAKGKAGTKPAKGAKRRADYKALAQVFLENGGYGAPGQDLKLRYFRDAWWEHDGRKWLESSDSYFKARLTAFLQSPAGVGTGVTNNLVGNVVANLRGLVHFRCGENFEAPAWIEGSKVSPCPRLLSLANGILDLGQWLAGKPVKLREHTPRLFNVVTLPYSYQAGATCPRFEAFLSEVQPEADTRALLQEWTGYCLVPDTSMQRFLMLVGSGANGKSVYLGALRALVGEGNYSAARMQDFCSERTFQIVNTFGKLLNIEADLGEVKPKEEGQLKKYVDGSPFEIEKKNRDPVTRIPTARLVFATNTPPHFNDKTEGTWRRLLYVVFGVTIPEERQIKGMDRPAHWADELPGMLNWALEGLRRLYKRGRFEETEAFRQAKAEYRDELNPAARFLKDFCRYEPEESTSPKALYNAYRDWLKGAGHTGAMAQITFSKQVRSLFPKVDQEKNPRVTGLSGVGFARERYWLDLRFYPDGVPDEAEQLAAGKVLDFK